MMRTYNFVFERSFYEEITDADICITADKIVNGLNELAKKSDVPDLVIEIKKVKFRGFFSKYTTRISIKFKAANRLFVHAFVSEFCNKFSNAINIISY